MRLDPVIHAYQTHFGHTASLVVDVGSRDGDDCAGLVAVLGGRGVAVEPRPDAATLIRTRHPHLTVIESAVHEYDGVTGFAVLESDDPNIVGSSGFRFERSYALGVPAHVIQVPCHRLDTLLAGEPVIDVLKVDVEGFTLQALHGLGDRLTDVKVAHLETETAAREQPPWMEPQTNDLVADVMRDAGFTLVTVSYEWGPSIEDQVWINGRLL